MGWSRCRICSMSNRHQQKQQPRSRPQPCSRFITWTPISVDLGFGDLLLLRIRNCISSNIGTYIQCPPQLDHDGAAAGAGAGACVADSPHAPVEGLPPPVPRFMQTQRCNLHLVPPSLSNEQQHKRPRSFPTGSCFCIPALACVTRARSHGS